MSDPLDELAGAERDLVEKFLARTLLYNERMREAVGRLGLESVDVGKLSTLEEPSGYLRYLLH